MTREQLSLAVLKDQVKNNVTMNEIKEAQKREPMSPRGFSKRIEQLSEVLGQVKKNKDLFLNNMVDTIFDIEFEGTGKDLRRNKSMENLKTENHNLLNDQVSDHPSLTEKTHPHTHPDIDLDDES